MVEKVSCDQDGMCPSDYLTWLVKSGGVFVVLLLLASAPSQANDAADLDKIIKQGRAKAQGCTRCHGRAGMQSLAKKAQWENSISTYVIKQLLLFRGKRRVHEIMNAVAEPLSDDDIYKIAIWYESVSVKQ